MSVAANTGELFTTHYLHWTHDIRFERLVFEKSQKIHKTVENQKLYYSGGQYFVKC